MIELRVCRRAGISGQPPWESDMKAEHKIRSCLNGDSQHWFKIRKGVYAHMAYPEVR